MNEKIIIFFEKYITIIFVSLIIICLGVSFLGGFFYGEYNLCNKNDGVLVGKDLCVLDKCLEDISVCRDDNQFYFKKNDIGLFNLTNGVLIE